MVTWLEKHIQRLIGEECPGEAIPNAPFCDESTQTKINAKKYNGFITTGCRGITCEQCWNQESEE